jgi:hypothetical protein
LPLPKPNTVFCALNYLRNRCNSRLSVYPKGTYEKNLV